MTARVIYEHTSPQEYLELPGKLRLILRKALEAIAKDPLHPPGTLDVTRIRDHPGYWRLVLENHRVVYRADAAVVEVWFIELRTPETYDRLGELPGTPGKRT
jgi:mRNA-degrading endonuclease RelE of RelBE toxin-antitoxin system